MILTLSLDSALALGLEPAYAMPVPLRIASSTPFTNRTESSVLNVRASSMRFVEHDGRRRVGLVLQLPDGHAENQPIDHGQPLEPPVLASAAR